MLNFGGVICCKWGFKNHRLENVGVLVSVLPRHFNGFRHLCWIPWNSIISPDRVSETWTTREKDGKFLWKELIFGGSYNCNSIL